MAEKTFEQMLDDWVDVTQQIKDLQRRERYLRNTLFAGAFPDPHEGTNKRELADGRILKATYPINRSVDAAAVGPVMEKLRKETNEVVPEDLFTFRPSLSVSAYRKLDDKLLAIVDEAVVAKPGTPRLEVV